MIEKQVVVDTVEINPNGYVSLRLRLVIVEDGVELASKFHRAGLHPSEELNGRMGEVASHLATMGYPGVKAADIARIARIRAVV